MRFVGDEFNPHMRSIPGPTYAAKQVQVADTTVNIQLWKWGGDWTRQLIIPDCSKAKIAMIVLPVTNANAIADLRWAVAEIRNCVDEWPISIIVVASKIDLEEQRVLSSEEAQGVARELGVPYFEVSAATGQGIEGLFVHVAKEAIRRRKIEQEKAKE
jgi:GTPase SAR1 family protein